MQEKIKQIAYFLCLIDDTPQVDLANIAFIIILIKIILAQTVDWVSLCAFAATILNAMHSRGIVANSDITDMTSKLQNLENTVTDIKAKI